VITVDQPHQLTLPLAVKSAILHPLPQRVAMNVLQLLPTLHPHQQRHHPIHVGISVVPLQLHLQPLHVETNVAIRLHQPLHVETNVAIPLYQPLLITQPVAILVAEAGKTPSPYFKQPRVHYVIIERLLKNIC
jgi:hypothetical protein